MPNPQTQRTRSRRTDAQAQERQAQALALYIGGLTYAQIADRVGYADKASAHNAVSAALAERAQEKAELADHARELVDARLESLWKIQYKDAVKGDPKAAEACLRVLDRFIRIHGLTQVKVQGNVTITSELDNEIETLMAAFPGGRVEEA